MVITLTIAARDEVAGIAIGNPFPQNPHTCNIAKRIPRPIRDSKRADLGLRMSHSRRRSGRFPVTMRRSRSVRTGAENRICFGHEYRI